MQSVKFLVLAAPLCLFGLPAKADCTFPKFAFFPEKNDAVVVETAVVAGTSCNHNFGEGPGYHFTGITVTKSPDSGTLRSPKKGVFTYTPARNFRGKDAYMFKVCAVKADGGKGCSTVAYVSTVQ